MSGERAVAPPEVLVVAGVTHGQRAGGRPVLDSVSLTVGPGRLCVIEGRSGSGKSTLCQLIAGLEAPDQGTVRVVGEPASGTRDWARIALLPQRFGLSAELTVAENVFLPGWLRERDPRPDLLESFGLSHLADRLTSEASRGEQQRVAIARAAVLSSALVVLDEPTSHQDEDHADLVVRELIALARAGSVVVVATHDAQLVEAADQVLHLAAGARHPGG